MTWYSLLSPGLETWVTVGITAVMFVLILLRRFNLAIVSVTAAAVLVLAGIVTPLDALSYLNWNVLVILWGYGMLALALRESGLPAWVAGRVLTRLSKEYQVLIFLCVLAMLLSSFMANPVVVLMLAPLAIELATRMKSSLFPYLVLLAVSSNMVTTVSMISDPPALILATTTGMSFLEFYWFHSTLSLGAITAIALVVSVGVLWLMLRNRTGTFVADRETLPVRYAPLIIFVISVATLALVPWNELGSWGHPGLAAIATGIAALLISRGKILAFSKEFDWKTLAFLGGIFIVLGVVEQVGLLEEVAIWLGNFDISSTAIYLAFIIWVSVLLSSFVDNVALTVLMIPVCAHLADVIGMNPFPLYFGMVIGTGIGGNLTTVGAAPNIMACGLLEKHGEKVSLRKYMPLAVPFSLSAVVAAHLLLQWLWL